MIKTKQKFIVLNDVLGTKILLQINVYKEGFYFLNCYNCVIKNKEKH